MATAELITRLHWPDAVSDGLTLPCSDCGELPRFDYHVSQGGKPMTPHEIAVLEMIAGIREWETGAWVNACLEVLQTEGYCTQQARITPKGQEFIGSRSAP